MAKNQFGFRRKNNTKKIVLAISGISAAVLLLAAFLLQLIYFGNKPICSEIGVGVGILGCKADSKYVYDRISIVVGNTQNTPTPALTEETSAYIANSSYKHKVQVSIYSVSSRRSIAFEDVTIREDEEDERLGDKIQKRKEAINKALKTEPTSNGAQYLDTIIEARNNMVPSRTKRDLIIVIGSGLSDGGILNFASSEEDLIHSSVSDIMGGIDGKIVYGSLEDTDIYWTGIGAVTSPQSTLTMTEQDNLSKIYDNILRRMGAEVIEISKDKTYDVSIKTQYTVNPTMTEKYSCLLCDGGKELKSDVITFGESEWTLVGEAKAKAIENLRDIIDELKKNQNEKATIEGYVSLIKHDCSIGENGNVDMVLAQNRANEVKKLLVEEGVPEGRINAVGVGRGERTKNECAGNVFDEDVARNNMMIYIWAEIL